VIAVKLAISSAAAFSQAGHRNFGMVFARSIPARIFREN
jgi:hypothetical protein